MPVLAKETALATWECPICNAENTHFLVENERLPDDLQCSFCGHESGLIEWKDENMGTPVTVQNKIKLLQDEAERELKKELRKAQKELNNDHTLVLDLITINPQICRPLALACELLRTA